MVTRLKQSVIDQSVLCELLRTVYVLSKADESKCATARVVTRSVGRHRVSERSASVACEKPEVAVLYAQFGRGAHLLLFQFPSRRLDKA